MEHIVRLSGPARSSADVGAELGRLDWIDVREPRRTDHLALDANSVSLIVGSLGSVNALIAAVATVWAARLAAKRAPAVNGEPVRSVLEIRTDLAETTIRIGANGEILATVGTLPSRVDEITDIVLAEG